MVYAVYIKCALTTELAEFCCITQLHYDAYNKRFGSDGVHEPIDWDAHKVCIALIIPGNNLNSKLLGIFNIKAL